MWLPGYRGGQGADLGAQLTIAGRSAQLGSNPDVVILNITGSSGVSTLEVGIGPDPAVARTILRTLSFG